jgi:two-component system cell cycle response regulator
VTASHGLVRLPEEAATIDEALALADQRMYVDKGSLLRGRGRESRELLVAVLREREPGLYVHGCQVTERASAVARRLEIEGGELEDIVTAAALHDIGKIAIPESILNKPGPLDDDEWAFVRGHPITGERIMARSESLRAAGRLVRASHERWDGGGYPDGLEGDKIPLGARIVAVCDAYDAMVAERPYRPARSPEQARAELLDAAGTQFDPAIVVAFLATTGEEPTRAPILRGTLA